MTRSERLYQLLPAALRRRDLSQGEPLRALMAIFESELARIEQETETIWDDWFIETCEEWLVPYIGESLGVPGMRSLSATGFSQRAYVANTLKYRRRKGTAAVLEQLARDVTGHGSRVVEYFQRVALTPHLQHVREPGRMPSTLGTLDLRDALTLERLGGPFTRDAHSAEVRHITTSPTAAPGASGGLFNLPHVGLHLFRLQSDTIVRSEARALEGQPGFYHFDPFGRAAPLFNVALSEDQISSLAGPEHVARPLSRIELAREERGVLPPRWLSPFSVIRVRAVAADGSETLFTPAGDLVLDSDGDALPDAAQPLVEVGGVWLPRLQIAHLADLPDGSLPSRRPRAAQIVHVDPENGRLLFHPDAVASAPDAVLVDYALGYASSIGAGVWDRSEALAEQLRAHGLSLAELTRQWGVSRTEADGAQVFDTLGAALAAWNAHVAVSVDPASETGLIAIMDNRAHTRADASGTAQVIVLPAGARLIVIAADWPLELVAGLPARKLGTLAPSRRRALVRGALVVEGEAEEPALPTRAGGLFLNGLAIEGGVRVAPGALERLSLSHCTLPAPSAALTVEAEALGSSNPGLELSAVRCLLGPISAAGPTASARLDGCVVHGADAAIALPDATLTIDGSTVLGSVACRVLFSSNALFSAPVTAAHTQEGCVRFGYLAPASRAPRRFRCQPDQALEGVHDSALRRRIATRVRPVWTTLDPAHPAYAQLDVRCPQEITRGADGGCEMGAFHHLQQPWREDNLGAALRQYLRHGLEAGLRYES